MGKLDRYFEDVARIRAEGVSTNGWVTVAREHDGDIEVDIRPGMLRRCDPDQVATEIRTALFAAVADHRRQYRQLRIDYFGSPLGVEPFTPFELEHGGMQEP
ncbi:hypothetical protein ACFOOK_02580 [Micromonospora krabiensis]|uniref:YbaB/EbfC DNA-binding family protein n=1 Tax=Micromonospora krabiensis TaxID=307121 RepID=A0A1C3MWQ5_9ACTN|nr:hypothetical protein [Micromonospora krabiensis]SBV24755.1 hypothetical protein GA0070620_0194 [Micromonospora krabiensis]